MNLTEIRAQLLARRNAGITAFADQEWVRANTEVDGHGCWNWLGKVKPDGYGYLNLPEPVGTVAPHRIAYIAFVGPIPEGLVIDHLCENKLCANPEHLEPVTIAENIRRYHAARRARVAAFA